MSEKLSRRSFFRLVGGGVAAAVVAPKLLAEKIINIPVEFGWTWYVDKSKLPSSDFSKVITETLRNNTQLIADNISKNNSLLVKLKDGTKANLQIERIDPEMQNRRILARMEARRRDSVKEEIDYVRKFTNLSEDNIKDIEHRRLLALENRLPFEDETAKKELDDSITYYDRNTKRKLANVKNVMVNGHVVKEVKYYVT